MKSQSPEDRELAASKLSAMLDGEAGSDAVSEVCMAWRRDSQVRATWHEWSLIGDVMRSEDLANGARRDQDLLAAVRARLADEPVVLAPVVQPLPETVPQRQLANGQPLPAPAARSVRRLAWRTPVAVAAGCAMVAGALLVTRSQEAGRVFPGDLYAGHGASPVAVSASGGVTLLRNPELDRYLQAHRQYAQGPALAAPGGVRQVAVTSDGR